MKHLYYPGVGPVEFVKNEVKTILGKKTKFLLFKDVRTGMTIMLPEKDILKGRRKLATKKEALVVKKMISGEPVVSDHTLTRINWNQRYRKYQSLINDGSLTDIATVLQDLKAVAQSKELSFGEKKMKGLCEELITTELEIVLNQ